MPDLRYRGERGFEGGDGAGVLAIHRDVDESFEAEADSGRVEDGAVAGDDAVALQFAQPPVQGAGVSRTLSASSVIVRRPSS